MLKSCQPRDDQPQTFAMSRGPTSWFGRWSCRSWAFAPQAASNKCCILLHQIASTERLSNRTSVIIQQSLCVSPPTLYYVWWIWFDHPCFGCVLQILAAWKIKGMGANECKLFNVLQSKQKTQRYWSRVVSRLDTPWDVRWLLQA